MASIDEALAVAEANVPICIIDPDTRVISVPSEYKNFGVESDEKVTRVHFQCPKIVGDNIDLTEFNLYINYRNANGELNIYLIDDVSDSGDNVVFSWLLSRHVTAYTGNVDYIVCAKKSDGTTITNEWNTKIATGTVSGGLEATKEIEEQNADVIEQILKRLDNDYITHSELQAATDKALAQAKASGEFDGKDGKDGKDGAPGNPGAAGKDGKTPIKGTDYWTSADKAEIVQDVLDAQQELYPVKTVIDAPVNKNTQYFLGTIAQPLSISFPATAELGDIIYINYITPVNSPAVSVIISHTIGLENFIADIASSSYELIGIWTGTTWSIATRVVSTS